MDNKVVSVLTTIDKGENHGLVNRRQKTAGVWKTREVLQPKALFHCSKFMNKVDRSD